MGEINLQSTEEIEADPTLPHASEFIKDFFEVTWQEPRFDILRGNWQKQLDDPEDEYRVMAKTALWNIVRCRYPDIEKEFTSLL